MIPCKAEKCISYPICLGKREITCQKLLNYFSEMHDRLFDDSDDDTTEKTWDHVCNEMHKQFKNLKIVRGTNQYLPGYHIIPEDIRVNEKCKYPTLVVKEK